MEQIKFGDLYLSKLTLGTAQLRMNYGIANRQGKPEYQKSLEILKTAADQGVNCFDTAPSYGDSEKVIGSFISSYHDFSQPPVIVTKLPPVDLKGKVTSRNVHRLIREHVVKSAGLLNVKKLPIYLLHRASDMTGCAGLVIDSLQELKSEGLIELLGVSTYTPEEVEQALGIEAIQAIQIPVNIFDHRLLSTGLLDRLKKRKFIVFGRSLFLQGLFFLNSHNLPQGLKYAEEPLVELRKLSVEHGRSLSEIALAFVRDLPWMTSLVVGAETPDQVLENVNLIGAPPLSSKLRNDIMDIFSDLPLKLINPSLWKLN